MAGEGSDRGSDGAGPSVRLERRCRTTLSSRHLIVVVFAAAGMLLVGCAPMQRVPLEVGPGEVEVYVDGLRVAEPLPAELDLKSNRAHVVFVKKPGHRPEQIVLRSVEPAEGPPRLSPDRVAVELRRETPKGRRLEVELDEPPPALPPGTAGQP